MKKINGYIEIDGIISKITSVEDLHHIVESLGKDFTDMTKEQLHQLTIKKAPSSCVKNDDCFVGYCDNVLYSVNSVIADMGQYKVADGTKAINIRAFMKHNVSHIIFPQSLIAIGAWAFDSNNITECVFPDSIQYIGHSAFSGCKNLCYENLSLPTDLRYLIADAFAGCVRITSVVFHDKIKEIGSHAFRGCSALKAAYIPDSVEKIGSGVFDDCPNLEHIYIQNGTKEKFEKLFPFDKDKLTEY